MISDYCTYSTIHATKLSLHSHLHFQIKCSGLHSVFCTVSSSAPHTSIWKGNLGIPSHINGLRNPPFFHSLSLVYRMWVEEGSFLPCRDHLARLGGQRGGAFSFLSNVRTRKGRLCLHCVRVIISGHTQTRAKYWKWRVYLLSLTYSSFQVTINTLSKLSSIINPMLIVSYLTFIDGDGIYLEL